ncbi:hypothetical protein CRG98_018962 [Punica granatum]|uniref:Uncharacterized protein n=1 Tax=Punica granatum TaxID=22663 RepID=A0A2I0JWE4_PUNGR|nr:hypothetical protein CRG98_018962 [Punica granatum]
MESQTRLGPQNNAFSVSKALFQSFGARSQRTEITAISGSSKQLRRHSEKSGFGLLGRLRLYIGWVDLRLFSQNDHCSHLQGDIRVNLKCLESNNHHSHFRGSVRSREPLTLPQNPIGRHRGDVRPENCPVGFVFQTYSVFR